MTMLIVISNDGTDMWVSERILDEEQFGYFVERMGLDLSFDYRTFLDLNGDYTGEITSKLNAKSNGTTYLALVAGI